MLCLKGELFRYDSIKDIYHKGGDLMFIQQSVIGTLNILKTKNGLFLTWKMVFTLFICIFVGLFGGLLVYGKKKKKWLISPLAQPASPHYLPTHMIAPSPSMQSNETILGLTSGMSSGDTHTLPILALERAHTSEVNVNDELSVGIHNRPQSRSFVRSLSAPVHSDTKSFHDGVAHSATKAELSTLTSTLSLSVPMHSNTKSFDVGTAQRAKQDWSSTLTSTLSKTQGLPSRPFEQYSLLVPD